MSWSIYIAGSPDALCAEIDRQSAKMSGACKDEFDATMACVKPLIQMNKPYAGQPAPTLILEGNGSGSYVDGQCVASNCTVKLSGSSHRFVPDPSPVAASNGQVSPSVNGSAG